MNGIELIKQERNRQINELNWTAEHDDKHMGGELGLVAALYSSPSNLYIQSFEFDGYCFIDPWPKTWDDKYDRRQIVDGIRRSNFLIKDDERIRMLQKAGALIAAEIDRIQRLKDKRQLLSTVDQG